MNKWSEIYTDSSCNKYFIDYSTFCKGPKANARFMKNLAEPLDEVSAEHGIRSWVFLYDVIREHSQLRLRTRSGFTSGMGEGDCVWSQGEIMGELDSNPIYEFDEIQPGSFQEVALNILCLPVADSSQRRLSERVDAASRIQFDEIFEYSESLAAVKFDGDMGFIDELGNIAIPLKYENVGSFNEGLALVRLDGKIGYINKLDQLIVPMIYEQASYEFKDGLASVKMADSGWGFINQSGNVIVPLLYDELEPYEGELAKVRVGEFFGFLDKNGRVIVHPKFSVVRGSFGDEGVVMAKCGGKWWIVNSSGKETGALDYEDAGWFSEGLFAVQRRGKWGFINTKGDLVIDCKYTDINLVGFRDGLAEVTAGQKEIFLDKKGFEYAGMSRQQALDSLLNKPNA
jgi:hypothetical protein